MIARAGAPPGSTLMQGGYLTSLQSGGENNILNGNRKNALKIVNAAIGQVALQTGYIGSVRALRAQTCPEPCEGMTRSLSYRY